MELSRQQRSEFWETLWSFYTRQGRNLSWRQPEPDGSFDPYKIMVSELMLQQTQVARVIPKYQAFLERFPDAPVLARAELGDVLRTWQGLGYNRRAKFLWQAAQVIAQLGIFPNTQDKLVKLPGIGPNTAGAILAYAYNQPAVFIETNVRSVYIHHFFQDKVDVSDKEILALLTQTLDREHPREFYWVLMDYGSHLKAMSGNPNRASKHYTKQSVFKGSRRQIRGSVIRALSGGTQTMAELTAIITDERLESILNDLVAEGLVQISRSGYSL